jgi:hypothetical protein
MFKRLAPLTFIGRDAAECSEQIKAHCLQDWYIKKTEETKGFFKVTIIHPKEHERRQERKKAA